jgi:hypothetical protein
MKAEFPEGNLWAIRLFFLYFAPRTSTDAVAKNAEFTFNARRAPKTTKGRARRPRFGLF